MSVSEDISTLDSTDEPYSLKADIAMTKEKLSLGKYTFSNKRGRSKVWDVFAKLEDSEGVEVEGKVACRSCYNIYKFDKSTSNLVKHKCYIMTSSKYMMKQAPEIEVDVGFETETKKKYVVKQSPETEVDMGVDLDIKKKATEIVTEWAVKNGRPLSIINDSGFIKLAEFFIEVGANYGQNVNIDDLLPNPSTVSQNISKLYELHFEEVKNDIMKIKNIGYSLTSDIWTDNYLKTSYVSLTMHYIKQGSLVNRLLAIKSMKGVLFTGLKIKAKINKVLQKFACDLDDDDPIIVCDRDSNMTFAFQDLNSIPCINHLLHNVLEKTLKEVPELQDMVNRCNKIIKYFKKSESNSEITLESYCPTRWNSVYYLLKSIETNWLQMSNILMEKNELYRLHEINNLNHLSAVVRLLSSFESASKKLEANSCPTLPLTIPYVNHLKKICCVDVNDVNIVRKCKRVLHELLETEVVRNLTKFHNVALFLFPPTNKLSQFSAEEKEQTIDDCREIMKLFATDSNADNHDPLSSNEHEEDSIFADYMQPRQNNIISNNIISELKEYRKVNIFFHEDFNVLQWWRNNKEQFPILFKTSCKILSTPASSAPAEKAFSTARNLISEKRLKTGSNNDMMVNQIMFLHSNVANFNKNFFFD